LGFDEGAFSILQFFHKDIEDNEGNEKVIIHWMKVEEGDKATPYTKEQEGEKILSKDFFGLSNEAFGSKTPAMFWLGGDRKNAPFRINYDGTLYANNAHI
jgi:hypothetical protein